MEKIRILQDEESLFHLGVILIIKKSIIFLLRQLVTKIIFSSISRQQYFYTSKCNRCTQIDVLVFCYVHGIHFSFITKISLHLENHNRKSPREMSSKLYPVYPYKESLKSQYHPRSFAGTLRFHDCLKIKYGLGTNHRSVYSKNLCMRPYNFPS